MIFRQSDDLSNWEAGEVRLESLTVPKYAHATLDFFTRTKGHRMDTLSLKYNKAVLISKIEMNRAQHFQDYREALLVYHAKLGEELVRKQHQLAMAPGNSGFPKPVSGNSKLATPEEHIEDYDRLLSMLSLTSQSEIELTEYQYREYVLDEWDWRRSFISNTLSYKG